MMKIDVDVEKALPLPLHELLDRFEILYPDISELADLRRAVVDRDLSSIFRLCEANEELRKAVIDENWHSVFRVLSHLNIPDIDDIRRATVEKNWHSLFRLLEQHDLSYVQDVRRAVLEQNAHSLFRLFGYGDMVEYEKPTTTPQWHIDDLRRAFAEDSLYSLFRLFPEDDEDIHLYRTAIVNKNLRSIFKLLDNDDLRKLITDNNTWKLWGLLEQYVDTQFIAAFKNFFVNNKSIDPDCFSRGQLESKFWLVSKLKELDAELGTVFLCAGWYATLATMLFESGMKVDKIRSFDIDDSTVDIAKTFNKPWVMDSWKFQASIADIHTITYPFKYEVSKADGSVCSLVDNPDTIINTSCEHIENFADWYAKIPNGKLVVLQSNNYADVEEHVNIHTSLESFVLQTPMKTELFSGELKLPKYTRYMRIGYK